ncbi:MAG: extracellular solute-binding protein [Anaerolineae bacterium]|nr:extracellular solute-binding protein [Anaerolineae bacterium]
MKTLWPVVFSGILLLLAACVSQEAPTPTLVPTPLPKVVARAVIPDAAASVVDVGNVIPPLVATPCPAGQCPFEGQTVTVLVNELGGAIGPLAGPLYEIRPEFEAATGAHLEIIEKPLDEHFAYLITDLTTGAGRYDASIAGAWWLGDLVSQDFLLPYDQFYNDPRFPQWDFDDVQPAPRSLLTYDGQKYMVAHDHDGQVMYYRRDLLADPAHQTAFQDRYGYALGVPQTWDQFRDVAEYFDGQDLNGDGQPDDGLTLHLKAGEQGMFHFMSFSAPFVIGPKNQKLYWFDPDTMKPLLDSPGHVRALATMVDLVQFGPPEMLRWNLGQSWDHFLRGEAALTFTWGDLGALAQQEGSQVKGKIGTAHLPGTYEYYSIDQQQWIKTSTLNWVGNTTGGSWAGVISKYSDAPEATYYLLALMATRQKSLVYAARGWDGIDPGRFSHYLPPHGTADIRDYEAAGWNETDVEQYTEAYFETFNNELQFPYLRIPGTFSYWTALDIHLAEAVQGQVTAEKALQETVLDFEELTSRLGRETQATVYRASLGF